MPHREHLPSPRGADLYGSGLVLGKFMPPHAGHEHLVLFAAALCRRLTVVVDRVEGETHPADERAGWLAERFAGHPGIRVVSLSEPTPQSPGDHPDFWGFWRDALVDANGGPPDALVASEDYGAPLAVALGCSFVPLDVAREGIPISATRVRADPWGNWDLILPEARRAYLAHVALEGPESTGKSTVGLKVARAHGFTYAPEWAKGYIEQAARAGRPFGEADLATVAAAQVTMERSLELRASRAVIHDSSLLSTVTWSLFLHGRVDRRIEALLDEEEARAPRERWLFTPDTPFHAAEHRNVAEDAASDETRGRFMDLLVSQAERRGLPYRLIPGGFDAKERLAMSLASRLGPPAPDRPVVPPAFAGARHP